MSKITQKLKSQSGASVLIALIFFLTAFMVGSAVLSSAASNSDKMIARKEERQRYFTLSSAARFLCSAIEGTKGEAWKQTDTYSCSIAVSEDEIHNNKTTYSGAMAIKDNDNKIQKLLAETAYDMYEKRSTNPDAPPIEKEFSISVEDIEDVDVTLTMNNSYDLIMELKIDGRGEIVVTVAAAKTNIANTSEDPPACTETHIPPLTTPHCDHMCKETIFDDGEYKEIEVMRDFAITTERNTLKIIWPTAIITKGAVAP